MRLLTRARHSASRVCTSMLFIPTVMTSSTMDESIFLTWDNLWEAILQGGRSNSMISWYCEGVIVFIRAFSVVINHINVDVMIRSQFKRVQFACHAMCEFQCCGSTNILWDVRELSDAGPDDSSSPSYSSCVAHVDGGKHVSSDSSRRFRESSRQWVNDHKILSQSN